MSSSKSKYWEQQVSKFQSGQRKSNAFPFFTVMIWWVGCVARMRFPLLFLCVNHMTPCEPPERDTDEEKKKSPGTLWRPGRSRSSLLWLSAPRFSVAGCWSDCAARQKKGFGVLGPPSGIEVGLFLAWSKITEGTTKHLFFSRVL